MKDLKIAAVCMHSETGEISKNLDRIEVFVSKASAIGVDLICFPELSISGYILKNPRNIYSQATCKEIIEKVAGMAKSKNMVIMAGLVEVSEGEKTYISQVVAGPHGLLGLHRKTHLSPQEKKSYDAGQKIAVFSHADVVFGLQLCYESHFPEISTVMALRGAEIIFFPHASPRGTTEEKIQSWLRHLTGRAFDNALFVVACNQVGKTREGLSFPGGAVALNPAGRIIVRYAKKQENMVVADLKMDEIREMREHRMKYFIPNRRPELYGELSSK